MSWMGTHSASDKYYVFSTRVDGTTYGGITSNNVTMQSQYIMKHTIKFVCFFYVAILATKVTFLMVLKNINILKIKSERRK